MAVTRFLTYYIVLTDPARVAALQAQFPYGYQFAPFNPSDSVTHLPGGAAVAFSAPWAGSFPGTDPNHVASGTYFGPAPYTYSPEWISANNYDCTVASFTRHTGGFWGMGGTTTTYYWLGQFVLDQPAQPTVGGATPASPSRIPKRRWIEGFEVGANGNNQANWENAGMRVSRDASRHVGGFGLSLRGANNTAVQLTETFFGAPIGFRTWTRLYLRIRATDPTSTVPFVSWFGDVSSGAGALLCITPDAKLALFNSDASSVRTLIATSAAALPIWNGLSTNNAWQKIDVLIRFNPNELIGGSNVVNITTGACRVFVNGVQVINATGIAAQGLGQNQHHATTYVGVRGTNVNVAEMDLDDVFSSDWPIDPTPSEQPSGPFLTNKDWLQGTKIVAARWKANGTNHANWVGDGRLMLQLPMAVLANPLNLTSSISGAVAEADLDIDQVVSRDDKVTGVLSFMVCLTATNAGPTNGSAGYRLNGAGAVDTALTVPAQGVARTAHAIMKSLVDGTSSDFPAFTSLTARHVKSADVNAATLVYLAAQLELAGTWGLEDYRTTENGTAGTPIFRRFMGLHNSPYPYSIYAKDADAAPPNAGVVIVSGSYVGNGTGQDITFRLPPCFVFIRRADATVGGYRWWSSMGLAHQDFNDGGFSMLARLDEDVTFVPGLGADLQQQRYRMRLAGNDARLNANAITYQYTVFCDPGARYTLAGALAHLSTLSTNFDNNLINPSFLAEFGLFFPEAFSNGTTDEAYGFGLSTPNGTVYKLSTSAALAAALTVAAGKLTTQSALHSFSISNVTPFLLWRRHDGNADPGEASVMALISWVGDGSGARTISWSPASGKRPIFAVAFGSAANGAVWRDVAHTTTNSMLESGANSTTGITGGGIDSISVGSTLNGNGNTYTALVLIGDATAGNGGFGIGGEFIPVEAAPPLDGPWPTSPTLDQLHPVAAVVPLTGEPDLDDTTAVLTTADNIGGLVGGSHCEFYTRKAVNIALSRIGISAQISNLATDTTKEAVVARRHVLEAMNATLRDFDWPFATGYATLVLVGGTSTVPVNADWQYSYRAPVGMMKARRLVGQASQQRTYDSVPILFRKGQDALGELIYTNQSNSSTPLVLEFTQRVSCPAFFGDALFRNAFAWRIAAELAPALSRDEKRQQFCLQMYRVALGQSEVPAANEQQQAKDGDADWIADRMSGPLDPDWWRRNGG
jgi:hypothetical protein